MIVLTLDTGGLVKVEIVAPAREQQEYHKLFESLRAAIEQLDEATKAAAAADDANR